MTRCRRAAQLVVLVRHARPFGLKVSQRFLQRVTFAFFYASVAGYPAGHRVNRSFGPRYHAGAVDPTQTGELTDNFLTCQVEWCYPRRLWDFPGEATIASAGLDDVADERSGSYAGVLVIDLW